MEKLLVLIAVVGLAGCGGPRMTASSDNLGGVRSGPRWGIVKYVSYRDESVQRQKRAAAMMRQYCQPREYEIVRVNDGKGALLTAADVVASGFTHVITTLRFECVE